MAVLGGGGGSKDTYIASTAVCATDVVAGKSYSLTEAGEIGDPASIVPTSAALQTAPINPGSSNMGAGYAYEITYGCHGDVATPDLGLHFYIVADQQSNYSARLVASTDASTAGNNAATDHWSESLGHSWQYGRPESRAKFYYIHEDATYWYYGAHINRCWGLDNHMSHRIFNITKSNYNIQTFYEFKSDQEYNTNQYSDSGQNMISCFQLGTHYQMHMTRNGSYIVDMAPTHDAAKGGPLIRSYQAFNSTIKTTLTYTSLVEDERMCKLFKIDDTAGTFLLLYHKNVASYGAGIQAILITVAADGTMSSSACSFSGTAGANSLNTDSNFHQTKNALVFYATTMPSKDAFHYQKMTLDVSTATITYSTAGSITIPASYQSTNNYGHNPYWASDWDTAYSYQNCYIPSREIMHIADSGNGRTASGSGSFVIKLPAVGEPSFNQDWPTASDGGNAWGNQPRHTGFSKGVAGGETHTLDIPWSSVDGDNSNYRTYRLTGFYDPTVLVTYWQPAIALANATKGSTVNIALQSGDKSTPTLPSDKYLTKEGMTYPLVSISDALNSATASGVVTSQDRFTTHNIIRYT